MALEQAGPGDPTTIVVADDHAVVREGIRLLLDAEDDLHVVAEAEDADGTLRMIRGHKPDVAVLDLALRESHALDAIPTIRSEAPGTAIVVLTMQGGGATAREVVRAGAAGFLLK